MTRPIKVKEGEVVKFGQLDFEQEPKSRKLLAYFRKWLKENYGPRCETRAAGCPTCKLYAIYDLLEINLP